VEAFTKAVTQLADGILTDVVRVRSVILESCSKVLWTYVFFYCIINTHICTEYVCLILIFYKLRLLILCLNLFWQLLPKLKEIYTKIVNLSSAVANAALEIVSDFLLKLADIVKKHEGEIKKFVHMFQEFVEGKVTLCLTHTFLCCIILLSSQCIWSRIYSILLHFITLNNLYCTATSKNCTEPCDCCTLCVGLTSWVLKMWRFPYPWIL